MAFANLRWHNRSAAQPRSYSFHAQELPPKLRVSHTAPTPSSCGACVACVRRTKKAPPRRAFQGSGELHGLRAEPASHRCCLHALRSCPAKLQRAPALARAACLLRLIPACGHHHRASSTSRACLAEGLCPADDNLARLGRRPRLRKSSLAAAPRPLAPAPQPFALSLIHI